jgi:hypothetical protein
MMPNGSSRELSVDLDSAKLPSGRLSTEVSLPSAGDVVEKRKLEKTISGEAYTFMRRLRWLITAAGCDMVRSALTSGLDRVTEARNATSLASVTATAVGSEVSLY